MSAGPGGPAGPDPGDPAAPTRRGRRPGGGADTRNAILRAARASFTERGFAGTSVRGVARDAGVDPALVRHYFGDKGSLLLHAARVRLDPRALVRSVARSGRAGLGTRIVQTALAAWESPLGSTLVTAARNDPRVLPSVAVIVVEEISAAAPTVLGIPPEAAQHRIAVVEAVMAGLFTTRFLTEAGPVAQMSRAEVVAVFGPILQRAVDGELG